jgi:hypothetical protein
VMIEYWNWRLTTIRKLSQFSEISVEECKSVKWDDRTLFIETRRIGKRLVHQTMESHGRNRTNLLWLDRENRSEVMNCRICSLSPLKLDFGCNSQKQRKWKAKTGRDRSTTENR